MTSTLCRRLTQDFYNWLRWCRGCWLTNRVHEINGSFHSLISATLSVCVVQYHFLLQFAAKYATSFMKLHSQTVNVNIWIKKCSFFCLNFWSFFLFWLLTQQKVQSISFCSAAFQVTVWKSAIWMFPFNGNNNFYLLKCSEFCGTVRCLGRCTEVHLWSRNILYQLCEVTICYDEQVSQGFSLLHFL